MAVRTRTFLGLDLPPEARSMAGEVIRELRGRTRPRAVKWVAPEKLHITLRFFGDLDPERLAQARRLVGDLAGTWDGVATRWQGLGCFPSPRRVQVIWLGLVDPHGALRAVAREVNRRLVRAGFGRPDKPFAGHVTLGRVRRGERVAWEALSERLTIPQAAFSITQLVLWKSVLTPAGPEYTPMTSAGARSAEVPPPEEHPGGGRSDGD